MGPLTVDVPADVRQLLARLELLSHGATQAWNSAGGHGISSTVLPFGERFPPHETYRRLYVEASTDEARAAVVADMREALNAARGQIDRSHVVGESRDEEDARIVEEGRGFTAEEVARHFNCTPTRVRAARMARGYSARDGHPTGALADDGPASGLDPKAEAQHLRSKGMTQRQIALALKLPKSTVARWLKAAA